jgi:hypothetical protein
MRESHCARSDMRVSETGYAGANGFKSSAKIYEALGTVWLARSDGLPLPSYHIEVLLGYIRDKMGPRFIDALRGVGLGQAVPGREPVLNSITKIDFMEYWNIFKATKAQEDPQLADMPSPYDKSPGLLARWKSLIQGLWDEQKKEGWKQQSKRPRLEEPTALPLDDLLS